MKVISFNVGFHRAEDLDWGFWVMKCLDLWGEVSMGGYLPHIINCSFEDLHWPRSVPVTALETKKAAHTARSIVGNAWLA
jgi:hypothetical protein